MLDRSDKSSFFDIKWRVVRVALISRSSAVGDRGYTVLAFNGANKVIDGTKKLLACSCERAAGDSRLYNVDMGAARDCGYGYAGV